MPHIDDSAGEPRPLKAIDYDDDVVLLRAIRRRLSDVVAKDLDSPGVWAGAILELAHAYQALGGRLELEPSAELAAAEAELDLLRGRVVELEEGALEVIKVINADDTLRRGIAEYDHGAAGRLGAALVKLAGMAGADSLVA